mmetsp:Transcript_9526/g.14305  ORF Transcript_9526/g.14305 Transcript_9526/m.14305 type:complete len:101 (+) Transcript_9526:455-757(+)
MHDWIKNVNPRHNKMSKVLLPRALQTAMSPLHSRAMSTELIQSGRLDPIASTVKPRRTSDIPKQVPIFSAKSTTRNVNTASHSTARLNVNTKQYSKDEKY